MIKIAVVAGEASGDLLGADLLKALKEQVPNAQFMGIAGPRMQAEGCQSLYPMERLSVMGLVEVLKDLPGLLNIRRKLFKQILAWQPDVFIGIDAPDFNLVLERRLKEAGIKTIHYVSPNVWAWRAYRVKKIARSVNHILTLFPFEADFYRDHDVPVSFVGHPLFDAIPLHTDASEARDKLGLPQDKTMVGLLPGSRGQEVTRLGGLFMDAALWVQKQHPNIHFVVPMANQRMRGLFEEQLEGERKTLPMTLVDGQSHDVMQASDVLLMASGTAALEGMLFKRPTVVAYRMSNLSYRIIKRLLTVDYVSPPNFLIDPPPVPEYLQDDATVENLGNALLNYVQNPDVVDDLKQQFQQCHETLKRDSSKRAAEAVMQVIGTT